MGKGDPKAKRNRRKFAAAMAGVPDLRPVPRREDVRAPGGQFVTREAREDRDPQKTALEARARREGRGTSREDLKAVTEAYSASGAGCAIRATLKPEPAREALQALTHYAAARRRYEMTVLGASSDPQIGRLEMLPDSFGTDPSWRPDTRSDEERHRDAVNAHQRWDACLAKLTPPERELIERARHAEDDYWWDPLHHVATRKGRDLARALAELADIAD